jgi:hypothetical protein
VKASSLNQKSSRARRLVDDARDTQPLSGLPLSRRHLVRALPLSDRQEPDLSEREWRGTKCQCRLTLRPWKGVSVAWHPVLCERGLVSAAHVGSSGCPGRN